MKNCCRKREIITRLFCANKNIIRKKRRAVKVHNRKFREFANNYQDSKGVEPDFAVDNCNFTGGQLIVSLQPYLTVFLSARVVDLLSVHAKMEQVIALIVISGCWYVYIDLSGKIF